MKKVVFWLLVVFLTSLKLDAFAQGCAMCTATASNLDGRAAEGLNLGIVYLAAIPLILLATLFYKWYKANKNTTES